MAKWSTPRAGACMATCPKRCPPAIAAGSDDAVYYDARLRGQPVRMVEVVVSAGPGHDIRLRVAETLRKRHRLERKLLLTSIPFQAAILALAAWLAWSGTGAAARHANQVARRLASPRPDPLAPLEPAQEAPRELWPAVEAYNALLQRLDAMQAAQRRFVSNAAHQLRTPLAAMQVELESSLRQQDPQAQQLALSGTLAGLTRLQHLVNQLLMLSRSEDPHGSVLPLQPLDLAALSRAWSSATPTVRWRPTWTWVTTDPTTVCRCKVIRSCCARRWATCWTTRCATARRPV